MSVKPGDEVTVKDTKYIFLTKRIDDKGAWDAIETKSAAGIGVVITGKVYVLEPDGDGWKVRKDA